MPVIDGLSFLRTMHAEQRLADLPVIMLTAVGEKRHVLEAARYGIKDYLLKSRFSLTDLLGRVRKYLPLDAPEKPSSSAPQTAQQPGDDGLTRKSAPVSTTSVAVQPILAREDCLARAERAMQAKTLSGVMAQVIAEAASPRGSAVALANLISRDSVLSARVLQTANSASYASGRPVVASIPDAVRQVGCSTVRNLAAGLGIFDVMPPSEADGFNPIRCWQITPKVEVTSTISRQTE